MYCCGPEPLLAAAEERCRDWPAGSLHVERFAPRKLGAPAWTGPFQVVLQRSGRHVEVPPERSVPDAVESVPDHRDSVLDPQEREAGDCMMICISRSCGPRLVLDL